MFIGCILFKHRPTDVTLFCVVVPFKHVSTRGFLDHEENPPSFKGPSYSPTSHLLPPLSDRVKGRGGISANGHLILVLCEPATVLKTVQHIVWSHDPLS